MDWQLQHRAMERATQLLLEVTGGKPGPVVEVVSTGDLPQQPALTLRTARIERVLGLPMSQERSQAILEGLGFAVTPGGSDSLHCVGPSWRFDMAQEVANSASPLTTAAIRMMGLHPDTTQT